MLLPFIPALICFPSLRYDLALDGADARYYGFPVPWNSDSLATSMSKDVYLLPLGIDILVACIVGALLLRAVRKLPRPATISVLGLVWVWGICCALVLGFVFTTNPWLRLWPHPGPFHVLAVRLHFGV